MDGTFVASLSHTIRTRGMSHLWLNGLRETQMSSRPSYQGSWAGATGRRLIPPGTWRNMSTISRVW